MGQGDSLLLITPDGKTMLVDGGGFGGGPRQAPQDFDIGEEVVSPVLWSRGIRHLDVVALSHAHSDHMGGLPSVLQNFRPDELWVGNNPPVAAYQALLDEAAMLGVRGAYLASGRQRSAGRHARSMCLRPWRTTSRVRSQAIMTRWSCMFRIVAPQYCSKAMRRLRLRRECLRSRGSKARCSRSAIMAA